MKVQTILANPTAITTIILGSMAAFATTMYKIFGTKKEEDVLSRDYFPEGGVIAYPTHRLSYCCNCGITHGHENCPSCRSMVRIPLSRLFGVEIAEQPVEYEPILTLASQIKTFVKTACKWPRVEDEISLDEIATEVLGPIMSEIDDLEILEIVDEVEEQPIGLQGVAA